MTIKYSDSATIFILVHSWVENNALIPLVTGLEFMKCLAEIDPHDIHLFEVGLDVFMRRSFLIAHTRTTHTDSGCFSPSKTYRHQDIQLDIARRLFWSLSGKRHRLLNQQGLNIRTENPVEFNSRHISRMDRNTIIRDQDKHLLLFCVN